MKNSFVIILLPVILLMVFGCSFLTKNIRDGTDNSSNNGNSRAVPGNTAPDTPIPDNSGQKTPDGFEITFTIIECSGDCPKYALAITPEGEFNYFSKIGGGGKVSYPLDQEKIKDIIAEVEKVNFFDLEEEYLRGKNCPDVKNGLPTVTVKVRYKGREKTIRHDQGCQNKGVDHPPGLLKLEEKLRDLNLFKGQEM